METYKVIADEDEIKWYWDYVMSPLKENEVYFVSRSARNKQFSEDERKYFQCGRSEMFDKKIIRHDDFGRFMQSIKQFEVRKDAWLTKSGIPYPEKCLVTYINIPPIDAYSAMKDQMNYLTEVMSRLTDAAIKHSQNGLIDSFYKVRKSFDSCQSLFARNFGHKEWIDYDFDLEEKKPDDWKKIHEVYIKHFGIGNIVIINTAGGLHVLIRKSSIKKNPEIARMEAHNTVSDHLKEAVRNSNEMVSLPGTFQYETHITRILNKEDFTEDMKLHK